MKKMNRETLNREALAADGTKHIKTKVIDTVCSTKYPVLLVHGVGFRDLRLPVYWGRIPYALKKHGAEIYYGQQDSWGSIETNAEHLAGRIDEILAETGVEKVNIIAHSKGGLDTRMVASKLGYGAKIASLTTVATPHYGSKTLDLVMKLPRGLFNLAGFVVDNWIRVVGDKKPDFLKAVEGFTTEKMEQFNRENPDVEGVYYQSYACVMKHPFSDINLSTANLIIRHYEGPNDGLVSLASASWGENVKVLRGNGFRGISHLDATDLQRMPFTKKAGGGVSDICDVYVDMVRDLKERGL